MLVYTLKDLAALRTVTVKTSEKRGEASLKGAFADDDTLTLSVGVPRALCAERVSLRIYRDDDMSVRILKTRLIEFGADKDVYAVTLKLSEICIGDDGGLFYYTFVLETPFGVLYTERGGKLTYNGDAVSCEQLTVYSASVRGAEGFGGGMMYQIFVDRFFDGGRPVMPGKGKVRNGDWENGVPMYAEKPGDALANNEFFGGNLWGVADKLDYISSLGVDTLYLCPIFEAASNHKYDTGDYMKIDPMFGGEEAFDNLVRECKSRGMKLILDGVFNHTGADSRYFNKFGSYDSVGAYNSEDSQYYKWYSFDNYPDEYNCWWDIKILPAVKSAEPSYREFICGEEGVIRHWLRRGIDGWRLDVADELSDVFLNELHKAAREESPGALIIGEVWEDASNKIAYDKRRKYFRTGQLDSVMNYPLKEAVIDYILSCDCTGLRNTAAELFSHYPEHVSHSLMNFLGTHDTERILTVLSGVGTKEMTNRELAGFRLDENERSTSKKRLMLAFALLCAFPGIPSIYYGDEAGMEGGRDPFNRMPYIWGREDAELVSFYRTVGNIRRSEPIFAKGDLCIVDTGDPAQFMLCREYMGKKLCAAVNMSEKAWEIEFESPVRSLIKKGESSGCVTLESRSVEYYIL